MPPILPLDEIREKTSGNLKTGTGFANDLTWIKAQ
jgi:hypothetical protein